MRLYNRDRFRRALVELREVMEQIVGNDVDIGKTVVCYSMEVMGETMRSDHFAASFERIRSIVGQNDERISSST